MIQPSQTVAGILDLREEHGFLRVNGYLPTAGDVYVSPGVIRRHHLRWGDYLTGAAGTPNGSDGQGKRDKRQPLLQLDTVNGVSAEQNRRPVFHELTPLYPQQRLRMETQSHVLTTRVIDLVMPIGKGQRALIVSPPKAGKTMVLQAIAQAIAVNHPECHLMAVLIDERPEEVTDMQRTVGGEVLASTFDRPPADHIALAELAIERAKRLVELGQDVIVLLDSITRLARAYNLAAPSNGRTLSGGIDSTALYAPKRFLGAARNVEGGGSLTIIASALIETGSAGDSVIFEEFKSTGNAEFRLLRAMADRRLFPAVDIDSSGTRKEEILLAPDELAIVRRLRKALQALDPMQRVEQLLDRLNKTGSNTEFLLQLNRS
jgi:transcription termination factor Rho